MIDSSNTELSVVTIISDNNDDMEKDTSYELEAINPPTKVENDSMASGNPEDHGDSETVPEESDENDQVKENENEDTTGVFGCEDAAQQVLMYVCPPVCLSPKSEQFQNVPDCTRMFQNACSLSVASRSDTAWRQQTRSPALTLTSGSYKWWQSIVHISNIFAETILIKLPSGRNVSFVGEQSLMAQLKFWEILPTMAPTTHSCEFDGCDWTTQTETVSDYVQLLKIHVQ